MSLEFEVITIIMVVYSCIVLVMDNMAQCGKVYSKEKIVIFLLVSILLILYYLQPIFKALTKKFVAYCRELEKETMAGRIALLPILQAEYDRR